MGDRCTGHCCRDIVLSITLAELLSGRVAETGSPLVEAGRIASMMQPIHVDDDGDQHYRCLYLMGCGDCGIYSSRPEMCRSHPSIRCKNPDCTWDAAREGRVLHGKERNEINATDSTLLTEGKRDAA